MPITRSEDLKTEVLGNVSEPRPTLARTAAKCKKDICISPVPKGFRFFQTTVFDVPQAQKRTEEEFEEAG